MPLGHLHEPPKNIHPRMQEILHEFFNLFVERLSLLPTWKIDHGISLKEGTELVNVRPYKYTHYQKNEIEKQVQEMLRSGLVRPQH
jgi:hypothetical protein